MRRHTTDKTDTPDMGKINVTAIIEGLGGPANIRALYAKHKRMDVGIKTIQKWRERNSLTLARYQELQDLAAKIGQEI